MRGLKRKMVELSRAAWSSCPYTVLGKKAVRYSRGIKQDEATLVTNAENKIIMKMKLGRNISLIGIFCPFFWMALFTGARGQILYFNAIHSGVVIAIGLIIVATYGLRLRRLRSKLSYTPSIDHSSNKRQKKGTRN